MAGILNTGWNAGGVLGGGYSPSSGGLLTAAPQMDNRNKWADAIGILGATLQDVDASVNGVGRGGNLDRMQQRNETERLRRRKEQVAQQIQAAYTKGDMAGVRAAAIQDPELGASIMKILQQEQEDFGTTPVRGADGSAYLVGKRGSLKPLDISLPDPHAMTPYQQAQLDISRGNSELSSRKFAEDIRHNRALEAAGAKAPAGYRWGENGQLAFIPGGPADPTVTGRGNGKMTEDQAKNSQFYTRASQQLPIALKYFDSLGSGMNQVGAGVAGLPLVGGFIPKSVVTGGEYQRAQNAVKDIAQTYIYSTSGASAPDAEVERTMSSVIPSFGDSAQTKADKKARLQQMVESIKQRATPGASSSRSPANGGVDDLLKKYREIGLREGLARRRRAMIADAAQRAPRVDRHSRAVHARCRRIRLDLAKTAGLALLQELASVRHAPHLAELALLRGLTRGRGLPRAVRLVDHWVVLRAPVQAGAGHGLVAAVARALPGLAVQGDGGGALLLRATFAGEQGGGE